MSGFKIINESKNGNDWALFKVNKSLNINSEKKFNNVEEAIDAIIADKLDFIKDKGMASVGPLMGMVMAKLGGSADGKLVNSILLEKIKKINQQ